MPCSLLWPAGHRQASEPPVPVLPSQRIRSARAFRRSSDVPRRDRGPSDLGALGAEVSGIDLSKPLEAEQFQVLRNAFFEHSEMIRWRKPAGVQRVTIRGDRPA